RPAGTPASASPRTRSPGASSPAPSSTPRSPSSAAWPTCGSRRAPASPPRSTGCTRAPRRGGCPARRTGMTRLLTALRWLTTPGRYQSIAVGALFLAAVTVAEIDAADVGASLASLTLIQALREGRRKEGTADGD